MSFGPEIISNYDLSSLKVLGSVGEPINPEAWRWYDDHVRTEWKLACVREIHASGKIYTHTLSQTQVVPEMGGC